MDVNSSSAAGNAVATSAGKSRVGLADNFDSFLQLLTAQLKAQDPLSPLDANQFTQQLVQFSGVEQAIKTNEALGQLVALVQGDQLTRSLDYIGAEVEAEGGTIQLGAGAPATVGYELAEQADRVRIRSTMPAAAWSRPSRGGPAPAGTACLGTVGVQTGRRCRRVSTASTWSRAMLPASRSRSRPRCAAWSTGSRSKATASCCRSRAC